MNSRAALAHLLTAVFLAASALPATATPVSAGDGGHSPVTQVIVPAQAPAPVQAERPAVASTASDAPAAPAAEVRRAAQVSADVEAKVPTAEIEAAFNKARRQEFEAQALDVPNHAAGADPLRSVARSLVNVTARAPNAAPAAAPKPQNSASERDPLAVELDEDVRAAVLDMKSAVADVVRFAFNPKADENGRVTFSVAGIEGFHLNSDGQQLSLGIGDTQLGNVALSEGRSGTAGMAPRDLGEDNIIRRALNFFFAVIDHPLTWLMVVVLILGWFVVAVVSAQTRNSH